MKLFNLILILLLAQYTFAQGTFEKGTFVNNQNETINCLIKNEEWKFSPTTFEYRLTSDSKTNTMSTDNVSRFEINGACIYKRAQAKIDMSSEELGKLSTEKDPIFEEKTVFLKALVLGSVQLYEYSAPLMTRFFYSQGGDSIEPLIYKRYTERADAFKTNETYKHQLNQILKAPHAPITDILNAEYSDRSLKKIFKKYNEQVATADKVVYIAPTRKPTLQVWLQPSIRVGTFATSYFTMWNERFSVDFGTKANFAGGFELEYVLPYQRKRWSLFISPLYAQYKASQLSSTQYAASVNYQVIEMPWGGRYHYHLPKNQQLFVSLANVRMIDLKKSSLDVRVDGLIIESLPTYMLGVGYLNGAFSVECRSTLKHSFAETFVRSDYSSVSLTFGWRLARF